MKTQDAIAALRPLTNWTKSIAKLNEVLDLIQEKESLIDSSETRLSELTQKIEIADAKYATMHNKHEEAVAKLAQEYQAKEIVFTKEYEKNREELYKELEGLDKSVKLAKENSQKVKNDALDELAVIQNQIRDKEKILADLAENLKTALLNTSQFVNQMNKQDPNGDPVV